MKFHLIAVIIAITAFACSPVSQGAKKQKAEALQTSLKTGDYISDNNTSTATFAAGCFWCLEAVFESVIGVHEAVSGYSGGHTDNPTYRVVGSGTTGHAEAVEVYYDSTQITFPELVKVFFASQDPTQVNGQGPDHGSAYRTISFYRNETEKEIIENKIAELTASRLYSKPIASEVYPFEKFWIAEDYHQDYVVLNPNSGYVRGESIPRLRRTQRAVPELIKADKRLKQ